MARGGLGQLSRWQSSRAINAVRKIGASGAAKVYNNDTTMHTTKGIMVNR